MESEILDAGPSIAIEYDLGPSPNASGKSSTVEASSQGIVTSRVSVENL